MELFKPIKEIVRVNTFDENFRKILYAYKIHTGIYLMKTPVASITASIQELNFLQA
jgi:hypothetical protein